MSEESKKWLAGILATIIGGLILWYLTKPGGIFNPRPSKSPETKEADIKITNFNISNTFVDNRASATFTVYNNSETIAKECYIMWYSGSKVGKELLQLKDIGSEFSGSKKFSLRPQEKRKIKMQSLIYTEAGKFPTIIEVWIQKPGRFLVTGTYYKDVIVRHRQ